MEPGTRVSVRGLVSSPEHNGERGNVVSYIEAKQRYEVRLENGKILLLKRECVVLEGRHIFRKVLT